MTIEEKNLLLKDICARLPYKPNVYIRGFIHPQPLHWSYLSTDSDWELPKPYLRPTSSMTEEEARDIAILHGNKTEDILSIKITDEYIAIILDDGVCGTITSTIWYDEIISSVECFDYLNKKMFDYRGLIPMGLALEAPEGMYEIPHNTI